MTIKIIIVEHQKCSQVLTFVTSLVLMSGDDSKCFTVIGKREKARRGKREESDGLRRCNPDPGSRRRSGQPEVFRFYSGSDLGIKEAGKKEKNTEQRAGETARGNDEAGADPFLQASNLVADII